MFQYLFLTLLIPITLYCTVKVSNVFIKISVENVKYPEIDGIRGYLGFFVFLHHGYIWHNYLKTNLLESPKSNLFNHLGQTSVVIFFIITSFLFVTKLIKTKNVGFNWKKYIISRFYRLFPMYIFSIFIIFICIAYLTNFKIKDTLINNFRSSLSWVFFNINGPTNINSLENIFLINSGVAWTLQYEWMFYLLLPMLALVLKIRVDYKIIIYFTLAFLLILFINKSSLKNFIPFLGGMICAIISINQKISTQLKHFKFTIIAIALLTISIYNFNSGKNIIPVITSTFLLLIVANHNSFSGILSNQFTRKLGQITYSIYLIHGIILFIAFRFIIGFKKAAQLTEFEYWNVIAICIIPIILISKLTFKYIELPFINFNKRRC